ncbi:MAG: FliH/SctL family protein [Steroidobacteraceae bacterium]
MAQLEFSAGNHEITVQPWNAPAIGGVAGATRGARRLEDMHGGERRAWQEAEAAGRAAGLAAVRAENEARERQLTEASRTLESALQSLSRPLAQLDDAVHGQIAELATLLARALLRRELRTEPTQIIGIVRDTVALLPASARGVRVVLHPEDAALVRERLSVTGPEQAWAIIDDPVLSRGDCRVHTDYAQIDARIETRLNEALALLLGDERDAQRMDPAT